MAQPMVAMIPRTPATKAPWENLWIVWMMPAEPVLMRRSETRQLHRIGVVKIPRNTE